MMGLIFIYAIVVLGCLVAFKDTFWGVLVFYALVFLEPEWNWRWAIERGSGLQLYLGIAVLASFVIHGLRGNQFPPWALVTIGSLLAFFGLAKIAQFQSIDARLSAPYMDVLLRVLVIAIVAFRVIDTPKKALIFTWIVIITQAYSAYQINIQYFADGYSRYARRDWGYKGDNNTYSIFTIPVIALSMSTMLLSERFWVRAVAGVIASLQVHQLMLLESRGSMIGVMLLVAIVYLIVPKNKDRWLMILGSLALGAALAGPSVIEEFSSSFQEGERLDESAASRYTLWKAGFEITSDYPLFGVGPFAGQLMVPRYAIEYSNLPRKGLHNLFFEISTGCGVPAAVAYLAFFTVPCLVAWRIYLRDRKRMPTPFAIPILSLCCGIPGYMLASMFSSGALLESAYTLVACGGGALCAYQRVSRTNTTYPTNSTRSPAATPVP
jgi:O-antigen ligase